MIRAYSVAGTLAGGERCIGRPVNAPLDGVFGHLSRQINQNCRGLALVAVVSLQRLKHMHGRFGLQRDMLDVKSLAKHGLQPGDRFHCAMSFSTICAESATRSPDNDQMCRSWTDVTPCTAAIARPDFLRRQMQWHPFHKSVQCLAQQAQAGGHEQRGDKEGEKRVDRHPAGEGDHHACDQCRNRRQEIAGNVQQRCARVEIFFAAA